MFHLFIQFYECLSGTMFPVYKFQLIQNYNLILSKSLWICQCMTDRYSYLMNCSWTLHYKNSYPTICLLMRCWISQGIFPPYAPGLTTNGDSMHVTEHTIQVSEDAVFFKLSKFFSELQVGHNAGLVGFTAPFILFFFYYLLNVQNFKTWASTKMYIDT